MSLLVCTPVYGQPFMPYVESMMSLQEAFLTSGLKHEFLFIKGESLVQRARNNSITSYLETDFERFLFIDADIEFSPKDVAKLWNLDADVAVGCYPMKRLEKLENHPLFDAVCAVVGKEFAQKLVYQSVTTAWKDGELLDLDEFDGPVEIDYAGTGFMMIKREVFHKFQQEFEDRFHYEGKPGDNVHDNRVSFNYFDTRVDDEVFLSEDYAFCKDWRGMGGKIILEPSIRLKHYGTYGFGE